ncbi:hypothetical protein Clacol_001040 [Clathrus columnatus]|uniref:Xylanolytic transcriptional activator regulatory domain-containing protein n=1 Tax=Clathrus columnatus TaxID=1419009 RepID=A0AAV5A0P4_9AGAM|nr:hypothetical protein Clacol_001040 [Clathrus columnatus]
MSGEWSNVTDPARSGRGGKIRACAECRRLKLRGLCAAIECFTDEATPRSLKANNLKNREEIQQLQEKVATLEAALVAAASNVQITPATTTTFSPAGSNTSSNSSDLTVRKQEADGGLDETLNVFGTLSVTEDGTSTFHGDTSMSEKSPTDSSDRLSKLGGEPPALPTILTLLSALFPFASQSISENSDITELLVYLPSAQDALETSDIFWYTFSHGITPICRPHFVSKIYDYFYPPAHIRRNYTRKDAHRLGLLYIFIALGLLADARQPMLSTEAEKYHQLARAALSLDPICDHPTLPGLQCMVALSWYLRCTPNRGSPGYRWCLDGVTLKLANGFMYVVSRNSEKKRKLTACEIVRDSRNWLSDPDEVEQREALCWELVGQEVWQAFTVGRPCSIDVALIDCQKPSDNLDVYGGLQGFQPRPVKYSEIVKLERELRQAPMPEQLVMKPFSLPYDGLPEDDHIVCVQRFAIMLLRETVCCLLHRRFLVMAMENGPQDPRKHPFWYSAYQAGCAMYRRQPALISRVPAFWSASFSAAVILGAMAARYWNYDFAKGSWERFESICALFKETSETSLQPVNALELLEKLHAKVRERFMHPERAFNLRELPLVGTQPAKPPLSKSSPSPAAYTDTSSDLSSSVATPEQFHSPSIHMNNNITTTSPVLAGTSPISHISTSPRINVNPNTVIPQQQQQQQQQQPMFDWKMPAFSNLALFPQSSDGFDPRQLWPNANTYGGTYIQDNNANMNMALSPAVSSYEQAMLMDVNTVQPDQWDRFLDSTLRR